MQARKSVLSRPGRQRTCPARLTGSVAALLAGLALSLPASVLAQTSIYWRGETSNAWNSNNWASDASGTPTGAIPGSSSDVIFSAAGATRQNTILEGSFTIDSLTINDPKPVTINSGGGAVYTLTVAGVAGTGVTVNSGAGLLTIGANVMLSGASNTIAVSNAAGAVFGGNVGGSIGLDKEGSGTLTLSGTNTYAGGTTVNVGMLTLTSNGALGTGNVSIGAGGTLSLSSGVTAAHNASTGTTLTLASATTSIVNLEGSGVQDIVAALIINGVTEPLGTYGATDSGATYTNIADFTGTGELSVVPEPSIWAMLLVSTGFFGALARRRSSTNPS